MKIKSIPTVTGTDESESQLIPTVITCLTSAIIHRYMQAVKGYTLQKLTTAIVLDGNGDATGVELKTNIKADQGHIMQANFYLSLFDDQGKDQYTNNKQAAYILSNFFKNRMKEISGIAQPTNKREAAKLRRNELNKSAPSVDDLVSVFN